MDVLWMCHGRVMDGSWICHGCVMDVSCRRSQVVHLRNVIAGPNLAEALKRAESCLASGHFWLVLNRRKIATCVPLNYILIPTNKYANISSFSL